MIQINNGQLFGQTFTFAHFFFHTKSQRKNSILHFSLPVNSLPFLFNFSTLPFSCSFFLFLSLSLFFGSLIHPHIFLFGIELLYPILSIFFFPLFLSRHSSELDRSFEFFIRQYSTIPNKIFFFLSHFASLSFHFFFVMLSISLF